MSWFGQRRRRERAYAAPLNRAWTPRTGDEIERRYAPLIAAHELAHDTLCQDYSGAQWLRYQIWVRVLDAGLDWRRLLFARHRITAGSATDWPDSLEEVPS